MPTTETSRFNHARTVVYLTVGSTAVLIVAIGLASLLRDDLGSAKGIMALAVFIGWASALAAYMPVVIAASSGNGAQGIMRAYGLGAVVRIAICLLAAVVIMRREALPTLPGVLTLVATYLTTLYIESAMVARLLWHLPRSGSTANDPSASSGQLPEKNRYSTDRGRSDGPHSSADHSDRIEMMEIPA